MNLITDSVRGRLDAITAVFDGYYGKELEPEDLAAYLVSDVLHYCDHLQMDFDRIVGEAGKLFAIRRARDASG